MDPLFDNSFEDVLFSLPAPARESVLRVLERIYNFPTMHSLINSLDGEVETSTEEGVTFLVRDNFQAVVGCLEVNLDEDGEIHAGIKLFG
jgi:hypothetical protein